MGLVCRNQEGSEVMISNGQSKALATAFAKSFPDCGFDVDSNVLEGWFEENINALTKTPRESLTTPGALPEDNQVIAYVQTSARGDKNLFIKDDPRVEPFKRHGFTLVPLVDGEKAAIQLNELDRKLDDCGALIRQLVHKLSKAAPDNDLAAKALDFLKRKGLQGSPLRAKAPQPTLAAPLPERISIDVPGRTIAEYILASDFDTYVADLARGYSWECERATLLYEELKSCESQCAELYDDLASANSKLNHSPFQVRVRPWMLECFGETIANDGQERNHRFLEEALELVQACGSTVAEAHSLVEYVFCRPIGEPMQETGGVMITLAALCLANGIDMHQAGEIELDRISLPEVMTRIREKQKTKPAFGPLPGSYPERGPCVD